MLRSLIFLVLATFLVSTLTGCIVTDRRHHRDKSPVHVNKIIID